MQCPIPEPILVKGSGSRKLSPATVAAMLAFSLRLIGVYNIINAIARPPRLAGRGEHE